MYWVRPKWQKWAFWRVLEFAKLANFRRVLEFDKFAGEWPLLRLLIQFSPFNYSTPSLTNDINASIFNRIDFFLLIMIQRQLKRLLTDDSYLWYFRHTNTYKSILLRISLLFNNLLNLRLYFCFTKFLFSDAPAKVTLTGPSHVRPDDGDVVVRCSSDSSNPPTDLTFKVISEDKVRTWI